MKWENLDWQVKRKLMDEYDQRHADRKPCEPEIADTQPSVRMTVQADRSTDLYVRLNNNARAGNLATGELRLVGASEHIRVELPTVDVIGKLIAELEKLRGDMERHDAAVRAYLEAQKQYKADKEAWEIQREIDLEAALKDGKFTEKQLRRATSDIPF